MKRIWSFFSKQTTKNRLDPSDTGIFDPYIPLGKVNPAGPELDFDKVAEAADPFFSEQVKERRLFGLFKLILVLVTLVVTYRLVFLQISQGQENYSLAEGNRLKTESIAPPRGLIFDRDGVALVKNIPDFSIILSPQDVPRKTEQFNEYLQKLAIALKNPVGELEKNIKDSLDKASLTLSEGLTRDEAMSLELRLNGINGIKVVKTPSRLYDSLPGLGHIVGYVGKVTEEDLERRPELLLTSTIGKSGIEKSFDELLQGKPGIETLEVDSTGKKIRSVGVQPSVPGNSLVLTIDDKLQQVAATSLLEAIKKNRATSGAAIALDPRNGQVLAMVSAPIFDNNIFSRITKQADRQKTLLDPLSPLVNRSISGQYPSGSTIKPIIASAALAEKVVSPDTKIDTSEGKITIGQWTFPDWKLHGITDVRQAIAESNNIFFYSVGGGYKNIHGLGADRLAKYLNKFGFGQKTNINIPGETSGLVPTPDWKENAKKEPWYIGDTYNLSIGQGDLLVTPLQLTRAVGVIANGGTLYQPNLLKSVLSSDELENKDVSPKVAASKIIGSDWLRVVREGMRRAVLVGSARSFSSLPITVAAKTGTAQFNVAKDRTHSWFTAFAPYENPEIVLSVIVEGGGEGFSVAAPVAKNIIEKYFNLPLTPIVAATVDE